jgi:hypothetical protein
VVNIVNQSASSIGGFRHYSGLLPASPGDGGSQAQASVRIFHVPAANAAAIYRGDIIVSASGAIGTPGAADEPQNIGTPVTPSVVIGNGGGTLLGNQSMAPNITRWVPGDTTSIIMGVCVGFGPITLYQAKNGFQYVPAATEAWLFVETDPLVTMTATVPTVPGTAYNLLLNGGADVKANAGFQQTRFGISGLSLDPATFAATATLPLRLLSSGEQIGNDPTSAGFVAKVQFNQSRHYKGGAGFVLD